MIQFEVHKTYKTPLRIKDKTSVDHEYHYIQSLFIFLQMQALMSGVIFS